MNISTEVNASTMADIAFLLLVFFLVTTTMNPDNGITVRLPAWSETAEKPKQIPKRNVFAVLINSSNELLVRGKTASPEYLRQMTKDFIKNPKGLKNLASDPTKALISLTNDRGTRYRDYLLIYNELKAAYRELWDEESLRLYGVAYSEQLSLEQRKIIRAKYPLVLSEAEPTEFGH